jgi:xylulokinase
MAWIAVDAGTSVIKAVAFDGEGREVALAREKTEVLHPRADFAEQSMDAVWAAVVSTFRNVVGRLREPVDGVAITAQGDGCWLVDAAGRPTGNAILWNDGRATEVVERWRSQGAIARGFALSGSVSYPGLPNAILHWLRENQPDRIASARYALTCNGWIFAQMSGRFVADLSDASNPFSDVKRGEYSDALIELYGIGPQRRLLPPIARGSDLIAALTTRAADELGIAAGTPVVMAPYDIVSTAYGAGAALPGQACLILGTTICAEAITADLNLNEEPTGTTIALEDGLHLRAMPTLTGCETLEWVIQLLGLSDVAALDALAATAESTDGILFLPYLSPAGERAPFLEPRARGSFHGLTLTHTQAQVARSVFEGLSFAIRECLQRCTKEITEVRVCGGGARSDLWCQIIADVTGLTVVRPLENEIGARGAFIFALKATGALSAVFEAAHRYPAKLNTFSPRIEKAKDYSARFAAFQRTRDLAREQWGLSEAGL